MKRTSKLSILATLALAVLTGTLHAKTVFFDDFECHTAGISIGGQVSGSTTWTTQNVNSGDQATVVSGSAYDGVQALYIANNGTDQPKASINLVSGGFVSSPVPAGSVYVAVTEAQNSGGGEDSYTIAMSGMTISRYAPSKLTFSVAGGISVTIGLTGTGYTYTPASWNDLQVSFDNTKKAASLYINGGLAATITGSAANFSVSQLTLGTYVGSTTASALYFGSVMVSLAGYHYSDSFETYTTGVNLSGQVSGSTTWASQGVTGSNQAIISTDFAFDGKKSLMITEFATGRPRVSLNFVNGGFVPSAAQGGEVSFSVIEKPNSSGSDDSFTVNFGGFAITRSPGSSYFAYSMTGGELLSQVPFSTENYTYTPGSWNTFDLKFDNLAQTAALYINGGYAAMLAMQSATADFSVSGAVLGTYSSASYDKLYFDDLFADLNGPLSIFPWRSSLYPANWQPGFSDAKGRYLDDYSYAGYHSGTSAIPYIATGIVDVTQPPYNADKTGATDSTKAIQSALDYVGTHGGGVAYLPPGTYNVTPGNASCALQIKYSHVVLRGAGVDRTFILNSGTNMPNKAVIAISPVTLADWFSDSSNNSSILTVPLSQDIKAPTTVIPVTSSTGFKVGDLIMVRNDLSPGFISQLGMTGKPAWWAGNHAGLVMAFCRRIVGISGNSLIIDIPTRYPLLTNATDSGANARVTRPITSMLTESGLENFSVGMVEFDPNATGWGDNDYSAPNTAASYITNSCAISVNSVENGWISCVNTYHPPQNTTATNILSCGIWIVNSRLMTVQSCRMGHSQYMGNGGNGYVYALSAQDILIENCLAEYGRHNFSLDMMQSCGNVILSCTASHSRNSSDFHQYLSPANLIDNITLDHETFEAYYHSAGYPIQGWTTTQSVFWNSNGLDYGNNTDGSTTLNIIRSDDFGHVYVIGSRGPAPAVRGSDFIEGVGQGSKLVPQSLYLDQRLKRLGPDSDRDGLPDAWEAEYGIITGPQGDQSGNGISNLLKYALGLDPRATDRAGLPSMSVQIDPVDGKPYQTFTYQQLVNPVGVTYTVEVSKDLVTWTAAGNSLQQVSQPAMNPDGITETVSLRSVQSLKDSGTARQFVRLRVTAP